MSESAPSVQTETPIGINEPFVQELSNGWQQLSVHCVEPRAVRRYAAALEQATGRPSQAYQDSIPADNRRPGQPYLVAVQAEDSAYGRNSLQLSVYCDDQAGYERCSDALLRSEQQYQQALRRQRYGRIGGALAVAVVVLAGGWRVLEHSPDTVAAHAPVATAPSSRPTIAPPAEISPSAPASHSPGPPAPAPSKTPWPAASKSTSLTVASFNMKVSSNGAQNATAVHNIRKHHFGVVGMQELGYKGIFHSVKSKLEHAGYDMYPKKYSSPWGLNATAIAWDASQFKLVKTDKIRYPSGDKHHPGAPSQSPVVWLEDKQTDQTIIVMNEHSFAFGPRYHGGKLRAAAGHAVTAKIKQLATQGLPIVLTGDFNQGYGPSGTAYCMLQTKGLMTSPFVKHPKNYCRPHGKTSAMGAVDHILVSPGIRDKRIDELRPHPGEQRGANDVFPSLGTDHRQVPYTRIVIPARYTWHTSAR